MFNKAAEVVKAAEAEAVAAENAVEDVDAEEEATEEGKEKKGKGKNIDDCVGYTERDALCVCVEGTGRTDGSHGVIHKKTTDLMRDSVKDEDKTVPLGTAKKVVVKAHQESFPGSGCKEDCLRAQLNEYYKEPNCKNKASLRAVDANGNPLKKSGIASTEPKVPTRSSV